LTRFWKSCGIAVFGEFLAIMRYLSIFFCGFAVFRTPQCPPPLGGQCLRDPKHWLHCSLRKNNLPAKLHNGQFQLKTKNKIKKELRRQTRVSFKLKRIKNHIWQLADLAERIEIQDFQSNLEHQYAHCDVTHYNNWVLRVSTPFYFPVHGNDS